VLGAIAAIPRLASSTIPAIAVRASCPDRPATAISFDVASSAPTASPRVATAVSAAPRWAVPPPPCHAVAWCCWAATTSRTHVNAAVLSQPAGRGARPNKFTRPLQLGDHLRGQCLHRHPSQYRRAVISRQQAAQTFLIQRDGVTYGAARAALVPMPHAMTSSTAAKMPAGSVWPHFGPIEVEKRLEERANWGISAI
jgi:hypothetical protein